MNNNGKPKRDWGLWIRPILALATLCLAFVFWQLKRQYESRQQASAPHLPVIGVLPEFTLTNQDARPVTLDDLKGFVWVGDIIFTRCAGPCPVMTQRMAELQKRFGPIANLRWVTLTTDPGYDTPQVMRRYGQRYGADFRRWWFLTGEKPQIARLAVDGLKLIALEKKPQERSNPNDLFIHSTLFVVVDKHGRLRAAFESTDPDLEPKLRQATQTLLAEP